MGTVPRLGARLARATFEPDLLLSDGEASLVTPGRHGPKGWLPFRVGVRRRRRGHAGT